MKRNESIEFLEEVKKAVDEYSAAPIRGFKTRKFGEAPVDSNTTIYIMEFDDYWRLAFSLTYTEDGIWLNFGDGYSSPNNGEGKPMTDEDVIREEGFGSLLDESSEIIRMMDYEFSYEIPQTSMFREDDWEEYDEVYKELLKILKVEES